MAVDARACSDCGLPIVRGVKYRTLLRMADAYLETGNHQAALSVCQAAGQILADRRLRSGSPASRAARARGRRPNPSRCAAPDGRRGDLEGPGQVAPRMTVPGVPTLEKSRSTSPR